MTSPAPVGYPDWNRTFASSRVLFDQELGLSINGAVNRGPFFVGNSHSVALLVKGTTNHVGCQLKWSQDAAGATPTFRDSIDVRQGCLFQQTVTAKAPWLNVTLLPFGGPPSVFDFTLTESPYEFVGNFSSDTAIIIAQTPNVGAGATDTQIATKILAAPAVFSIVGFGVTNWSAVISSIDAQGNLDRMIQVDQSSPHVPFQLYLPAIPIQVAVTNNDAAPHQFDYQVVAKTLYP